MYEDRCPAFVESKYGALTCVTVATFGLPTSKLAKIPLCAAKPTYKIAEVFEAQA
jgi:hypothetical protein